jgi:hypothetical protein
MPLPNFSQKTLYKNTILFTANDRVYSAGAIVGVLPFSLSYHATAENDNVEALAAPFGTPMVSSHKTPAFSLSLFGSYTTDCTWKSVIMSLVNGRLAGYIDYIVVRTEALDEDSCCDLTIESNQGEVISDTYTISGENKMKHIFNINKPCDDFRVCLDWSDGSTTDICSIIEIQIYGHYEE